MQVDWEPGLTYIVPNWGPAPNSTDLGASWLGTWADLHCSQLGPLAQFYRPWCKLTGNLGWPTLFPIGAPRPILQTLVQVDWEPGLTYIVPNWGPAPNSTDLGASWLGTWADLHCSQLGPRDNSTDLGASWLGSWADLHCSQLGPRDNSTDLGASWLGTWADLHCSQLGPHAQFYRPWCKLTGNLGWPTLFPIGAPRPILQTLVQVDWEPGLTYIVPNWGPAPNSTDLGASWLGTWADLHCSQLHPTPPKAGPANTSAHPSSYFNTSERKPIPYLTVFRSYIYKRHPPRYEMKGSGWSKTTL